MIGFQFEYVRIDLRFQILDWLEETYGKSTHTTWYVSQDYDLEDLILSEDIAIIYKLKWGP